MKKQLDKTHKRKTRLTHWQIN